MKTLFLLALALGASASSGFAATGAFGYGIELTGTGADATNSGTMSLYALDTGGGTALLPGGSNAMLSNAWTSASTDASPTFNLGSFDPSTGDTLILNGGSILTYQNGGDTVSATSQYLNYGVNAEPVSSFNFAPGINLPINSTAATGNAGDQRFSTEGADINLLASLAPGTYVLSTYGYASGNYENNSGANFAATFEVVPEPGTWATLLTGGSGVLLAFRGRKLRAS